MKFLADEICDYIVVGVLREEGHDVLAVCEMEDSMADDDIIRLACKEKRIFITEDKDFGQILHVFTKKELTVILIRYPNNIRKKLPSEIINLIKKHGMNIDGCFVVVKPGGAKFSKS